MIDAEQEHYVEAELEVKVDKKMNGESFQRVIQRLLLQIWDQYVQDKNDAANNPRQNELQEKCYVLTEFRIVSIDLGMALQLVEIDVQGGMKEVIVNMKSRKSKKILYYIPEDKTIGDIFNYQNNLVKVSCHFVPLRDLFYQQLTTGQISTNIQHGSLMDTTKITQSNSPKFNNRLTK